MSEQSYLIIYNDNWADEMDINGFRIMSESEWNEYQQAFNNHEGTYYFGIGTNEEIELDSASQILDRMNARKITEEEVKMLQKLFRTDSFGFFPYEPYEH